MLVVAIPMLFVYQTFGTISLTSNILLLMIVGLLVNGPYALITTAVSTELGTHQSLRGSARALATVTAIIDGTGSIGKSDHSPYLVTKFLYQWNGEAQNELIVFSGAAVGPLIAGSVSDYGWENVFLMLMIADVFALLVGPCSPRILKSRIYVSRLYAQLLARLVKHDIQRFRERRRELRFKRERIAWFTYTSQLFRHSLFFFAESERGCLKEKHILTSTTFFPSSSLNSYFISLRPPQNQNLKRKRKEDYGGRCFCPIRLYMCIFCP